MVFVSIVMESQHFKSLGSSQENTCLCFFCFGSSIACPCRRLSLCTRVLKWGWGGGENKALYIMHETLERAHATFYAIAQRIKQDKELQELHLQNNKIIINIVFVSTKFNMFMFILFVCLLVQFADMCSCLLKQMRFASCTLLDSVET